MTNLNNKENSISNNSQNNFVVTKPNKELRHRKNKKVSYYCEESSTESEVELSDYSEQGEDSIMRSASSSSGLIGTKRKRKAEKDIIYLKKELKKEFLWSREKIIAISEKLNLAET